MFTTSSIFVDSSVLIEAEKGTRPELFAALSDLPPERLAVNSIVWSEFLFHYLAVGTNVSPRTVKERGEIGNVLRKSTRYELICRMQWAEVSEAAARMVPDLMADFNLLPNDALIVATCLSRNIGALASFDPDFHEVCQTNGLALLDSATSFENWLNVNNLTKP